MRLRVIVKDLDDMASSGRRASDAAGAATASGNEATDSATRWSAAQEKVFDALSKTAFMVRDWSGQSKSVSGQVLVDRIKELMLLRDQQTGPNNVMAFQAIAKQIDDLVAYIVANVDPFFQLPGINSRVGSGSGSSKRTPPPRGGGRATATGVIKATLPRPSIGGGLSSSSPQGGITTHKGKATGHNR